MNPEKTDLLTTHRPPGDWESYRDNKLLVAPVFCLVKVFISEIASILSAWFSSCCICQCTCPGHQKILATVMELPYTFSLLLGRKLTYLYYSYNSFILLFSSSFPFEMSFAVPWINLILSLHFQIQNTDKLAYFCKFQIQYFSEPNILLCSPGKQLCLCVSIRLADHVVVTVRLQAIPCVSAYQQNIVTEVIQYNLNWVNSFIHAFSYSLLFLLEFSVVILEKDFCPKSYMKLGKHYNCYAIALSLTPNGLKVFA